MKKIIVLVGLLLLWASTSFAAPVQLQWKLKKDDRIEVLKTAHVQAIINSKTNAIYTERNIIDLTCLAITGKNYNVNGTFSVYTRMKGQTVFKKTNMQSSHFTIADSGVFTVPKEFLMPNLRHLPSFPAKKIEIGESWSLVSEIVIDSLSKPFSITMPVNYTLKKITKENDINVAYISYNYIINQTIKPGTVPADFPTKIAGKDLGTIKWNLDKNQPLDFINNYHILFLFQSGKILTAYEWIMKVETKHTIYSVVSPEEKKDKKEELKKELEEEEGITVEENDKGLIIRMGEVLFDFDSAKIKPDTKKTVDEILAVIKKKYPDREIVVEGHTDNTGNPHYNQELSEKRASSVASILINGVDHDKVSYIGQGEKFPIEKNNTAEGRKKNRRVDIIIKLN